MVLFFVNINRYNINATRIVVAAFAVLCGFTGIIAGFYEIQQGNVAPDARAPRLNS
jgi:succinate-acetate transporter protein